MRKTTASLAGIILILALAGCAPAVTGPTAAQSTVPAAPTVPSPTPSAPPALADLVLTPSGLGPLLVGSPVPASNSSSAVVVWNPTKCGATGAWLPNYPDSLVLDQLNDVPFVVGTTNKNDPVAFVGVRSLDIKTAGGIHVGSTAAELAAAYPTFDHTVDEGNVILYSINGKKSQLVFEFAKQASVPQDNGTVVEIEVQSGTADPVGAYGTDGFGYCPH